MVVEGGQWTGLFVLSVGGVGGERQMGIITRVKLSGEIRRDLPDKSGSSLC